MFCFREKKWQSESFRSRPGNAGLRLLEEQLGCVEAFKGHYSKITVTVRIKYLENWKFYLWLNFKDTAGFSVCHCCSVLLCIKTGKTGRTLSLEKWLQEKTGGLRCTSQVSTPARTLRRTRGSWKWRHRWHKSFAQVRVGVHGRKITSGGFIN